jgi:phage FluMu protein Com
VILHTAAPAGGLDSIAVHVYVSAMVEWRSGRTGRVAKSAEAKAAASPRQHRAKAGDGAVVVRCLHCGHEAVLTTAELVAYEVKPDAPIAGFVRRLRCTHCGSGSVLAKRVARPETRLPRQRRSA